MQVGDRVKVKRSGERGTLMAIESFGRCKVMVPCYSLPSVENTDGVEPVPVTVLEGEVYAMDDFADTCAKVDDVDLVKMLEALSGKRVRITIEELD